MLQTFFSKKKLYCRFLWMVFKCLKATESLRGDSLIFTVILQAYLVLISSVLEGRIVEAILVPLSDFEPGISGFGIQRLNH